MGCFTLCEKGRNHWGLGARRAWPPGHFSNGKAETPAEIRTSNYARDLSFHRPYSRNHTMKTPLLLLAAFLLPGLLFAEGSPRQQINFNRDWKFQLGDPAGAAAAGYDDGKWEDVGLPHSFSLPYFASPRFYVGYGWYRKHFAVPAAWSGRRIFLEFDGAFQDAEIFVNGRLAGRHKGGYTGFSLDITDALQAGDNVVAVRLNNKWNPQLAPRAGEHVFSGGIYRDVRLVVTDPLHVTWYGTFVTTPQVSAESGVVQVATEIRNDSAAGKMVALQTDILDPDGKTLATLATNQTVAAGTSERWFK
jgi:beta-galactosidase/beta-glucuronidase